MHISTHCVYSSLKSSFCLQCHSVRPETCESAVRVWKCWLQLSSQLDNPRSRLHHLVHGHHTPGTVHWCCPNLLTPGVFPFVSSLLTCFPPFWCLNPFVGSKNCSKRCLSNLSIIDLEWRQQIKQQKREHFHWGDILSCAVVSKHPDVKLCLPPDQTRSVTSAVACKQLQRDLAKERLNNALLRSVFKIQWCGGFSECAEKISVWRRVWKHTASGSGFVSFRLLCDQISRPLRQQD